MEQQLGEITVSAWFDDMVAISPPDLETRMLIIESKDKQMNLPLSTIVVKYIAVNLSDNIRQIYRNSCFKASRENYANEGQQTRSHPAGPSIKYQRLSVTMSV